MEHELTDIDLIWELKPIIQFYISQCVKVEGNAV